MLLTRERSLDAVRVGHWRITPPGGTRLTDPARFSAGIVLAADQLETAGSPATRRRLLTPRELEVLEALAHGQRIKRVAGQLNISENTVKQHVMNVRHKLGAPDRITAVLCAIRDGLIPFPACELKTGEPDWR
ncbi:MAG: LuxR C-terminal-related transcriptional regulator [Trueperaceae bacterium]